MTLQIIWLLAIGLTVFLCGMNLMRGSLEKLAEERIETFLLRFTKTPLRGFVTGTVITALLQSSTAVTVLTIGFVDAGMMTFAQSVGIILGTNIGTTVTTQLIALNIEDFSLPLFFAGLILFLFPNSTVRQWGKIFIGFSWILYGVHLMKMIAHPLKESGLLDKMVESGGNPILSGLIVGIVVTALIHSSSATILFAMGFYSAGAIPLSFALAVVLGSNVGTCVTGLIAALPTNVHAKRVAIAHLLLNAGGMVLFAPVIPFVLPYIPYLSDSLSTQIAHVQTLYNVICSLAVLPFSSAFAHLIEKMVPQKPLLQK
jgi:phosphate:Na+ symporter